MKDRITAPNNMDGQQIAQQLYDMPHPSKRKGNRFEREIVAAFEEAGLDAERAYASNGKSLATESGETCSEDVDVLVEGALKVQAKRRKTVAKYLKPPEGAHITAVREDRGEPLAVVPLRLLTRMLRRIYRNPPGAAGSASENPH